jgi:dihydrodipicolinate reductase
MTKIIINGCNGRMGQFITQMAAEDDSEFEVVAGDRWKR